jgi:hypothetical protein
LNGTVFGGQVYDSATVTYSALSLNGEFFIVTGGGDEILFIFTDPNTGADELDSPGVVQIINGSSWKSPSDPARRIIVMSLAQLSTEQ